MSATLKQRLRNVLCLENNTEIWLLLVRRVRGYVDNEGVSVRPYLILLYEIAPNTLLRSHHIVLEHRVGQLPTAEWILKNVLLPAMEKPFDELKQNPHKPKAIIFTNQTLYQKLQELIEGLDVTPQLWTEEENQGFGDEFVKALSRKLHEKGFGQGIEADKPGLLSVDKVEGDGLAKGIWTSCAEFFRAEPWKVFTRHHIVCIAWGGETRLVACTGREMEPGFAIEKDFVVLAELVGRGVRRPETNGHFCGVLFVQQESCPWEDLEAMERYSWPTAHPIPTEPTPEILARKESENSTSDETKDKEDTEANEKDPLLDSSKEKSSQTEETASNAKEANKEFKVYKENCFPLPVCFPSFPPKLEEMYRPNYVELTWIEVAARVFVKLAELCHENPAICDGDPSDKDKPFSTIFKVQRYSGMDEVV